ncbi:MAG: Rieske 2Fe-2S domain-containing protein [Acidimicrobiia bacterium]|nr:Rieske 2Fe-2S domain-containing protein [Acidimicrobiia bacterium]
MDATTLFIIGIVAAAGLLAIGVFTVAGGRPKDETGITAPLDRVALQRDRRARRERAARSAAAVAVLSPPETDEEYDGADEAPPPVDPMLERTAVSASQLGVTRRGFFNRALLTVFGIFLGQFAIAGLAFMWPKLGEGFGSPINLGNLNDLRSEIIQGDGSIVPTFVASAQTWLVPMPENAIAGSSFEGLPVVIGAGGGEPGLMALWQRCVHLGCRVPSCVPSQGFECPCHGSRYNFHGEYEAGPAPRNMDRFAVELDDADNLIVQTGQVIETPRASTKTIQYPQGPSCV